MLMLANMISSKVSFKVLEWSGLEPLILSNIGTSFLNVISVYVAAMLLTSLGLRTTQGDETCIVAKEYNAHSLMEWLL